MRPTEPIQGARQPQPDSLNPSALQQIPQPLGVHSGPAFHGLGSLSTTTELFKWGIMGPRCVVSLAMANYENVRGVGYMRFEGEADEPTTEQRDAKIEELYFDPYSGELDLRATTDDGHITLTIPVLHTKKWDEFVASLPRSDAADATDSNE